MITHIYNKYAKRIFAYIYYRTHNKELTEDIVADTFVKLHRELQRNPNVEKYVLAWLYKVAYNTFINYVREQQKKDLIPLDSQIIASDSSIINHLIKRQHLEQVFCAIRNLKEKDRRIIELRLLEMLPFKEIAVILSINIGSAKMRFRRALDKLKELVKKCQK